VIVPPSLKWVFNTDSASTGRERCSRTKQTKIWSKASGPWGKFP
jgi:hypothetical protein